MGCRLALEYRNHWLAMILMSSSMLYDISLQVAVVDFASEDDDSVMWIEEECTEFEEGASRG
jgi:hypothetical protein